MNRSYTVDSSLEYLAALMDDRFSIFGFRIGLNFIIDLIPGVGDFVTTLVALYIFSAVKKHDLPKIIYLRMLFNIAVYFLVGLIPWIGDLFGAIWKPNRRNLNLVRKYINRHYKNAP